MEDNEYADILVNKYELTPEEAKVLLNSKLLGQVVRDIVLAAKVSSESIAEARLVLTLSRKTLKAVFWG